MVCGIRSLAKVSLKPLLSYDYVVMFKYQYHLFIISIKLTFIQYHLFSF